MMRSLTTCYTTLRRGITISSYVWHTQMSSSSRTVREQGCHLWNAALLLQVQVIRHTFLRASSSCGSYGGSSAIMSALACTSDPFNPHLHYQVQSVCDIKRRKYIQVVLKCLECKLYALMTNGLYVPRSSGMYNLQKSHIPSWIQWSV